jgi:S1-C subfamily serine protease
VALLGLLLAAPLLAACPGRNGAGPAAPSATPLTPAEIAERALPSVVLIKVPGGLGTGFVVWKDGRIVTNFHVLLIPLQTGESRTIQAQVILPDGREFDRVEILAVDPDHDLAILKIPASNLQPLSLADSSKVKPGESVVAIGHPLGLGNTVSNGLVSAIRQLDQDHTLLQISAPIAPGSSGGPLFNDRGEVIGVATFYSSEGQNLNFGVPSNNVKPLLLEDKGGVPVAELPRFLATRWLGRCTVDEIAATGDAISAAIAKGVPLFNNGDKEGCYRTYAETGQFLVDRLRGCDRVKTTLQRALDSSSKMEDWKDKAWEMRFAFDRILRWFAVAAGPR